jgi:hypothetical protein
VPLLPLFRAPRDAVSISAAAKPLSDHMFSLRPSRVFFALFTVKGFESF